MKNLVKIVRDLCARHDEQEWFEFKENWFEPVQLGEYVSALSNAAACHYEDEAYFIWGVNNETHEIVGTKFNQYCDYNKEPYQNYLARNLSPSVGFDFEEIMIDGARVVVLTIPAAQNTVASTCAFKLRTIGIECQASEGVNEHYLYRTKNEKNRVAVVLSFTGGNTGMAHAAAVLKDFGYYVLGIGGSDSDLLKVNCSDYIAFHTEGLIMGTEIISSVTACNYVFDILFVSLLTEQYEKNQEAALEVYRLHH